MIVWNWNSLRKVAFWPSHNITSPVPQLHDCNLDTWQPICTAICILCWFPQKINGEASREVWELSLRAGWKSYLPRGAEFLCWDAETELKFWRYCTLLEKSFLRTEGSWTLLAGSFFIQLPETRGSQNVSRECKGRAVKVRRLGCLGDRVGTGRLGAGYL